MTQRNRTAFVVAVYVTGSVLLVSVFGAALSYWSFQIAGGVQRTWWQTYWRDLPFWVVYVLLLAPAVFLGRRVRVDPSAPRWAPVVTHLVAATVFSVVHIILVSAVAENPALYFSALLRNFLIINFFLYGAVVAVVHAVAFYQESVSRAALDAQLRADATTARLEALKVQLMPHFLFNTLNGMSVLALRGDHRMLRSMIENLSELLRFLLSDECPQEIPLKMELEILDRYLNLQRLHLDGQVILERDIAPEAMDAVVPSLILQPIVENAVVHGMSGTGDVRIEIQARRENGTLHLTVRDHGPGFDASPAPFRKGVGLRNAGDRLRHLYGGAYSIECRNAAGGGALVTVSLPYHGATPADVSAINGRLGAREGVGTLGFVTANRDSSQNLPAVPSPSGNVR